MSEAPLVAIVDYDMGNIFSVKQACEVVGLTAVVTSSAGDIEHADAVIVPGVGAFGDAMDCLERLDLVSPLRDRASSGKPLVGICLGMQLLMTESHEFGLRAGLDLVPGSVVPLKPSTTGGRRFKIPHVGWNRVHITVGDPSARTLGMLTPDHDGERMYFVHSYVVRPDDAAAAVATTHYGNVDFCSVLARDSVVGFQFHPERSGPAGLQMYANMAQWLRRGADAPFAGSPT